MRTCIVCITLSPVYIINKQRFSGEIEDFVETHLCKLRVMLRSRVLRVLRDRVKDVQWERKLTAVELSGLHYRVMCGCGFACDLFILVGSHIRNRIGLKICGVKHTEDTQAP